MSDYLEEGIVIDILRRLRIKNVVQCTAVCKSWYALIRSPFFISTHLNLNSCEDHLLFRHCLDDHDSWADTDSDNSFKEMKMEEKYCLLTNDNRLDKCSEFEFPFDCNDWCYRIVGCCNGLLCLTDDSDSSTGIWTEDWDYSSGVMILWYPTIRKSVLLPEPNLLLKANSIPDLALGFGFDPKNNDYKVVRFSLSCYCAKEPGAEVFSLNENDWRDISHLAPPYRVESMVSTYFKGATHWVARNKEKKFLIVVFDMSKEVFNEFHLPEIMVNNVWDLEAVLVYKKSLAVATIDRNDLNSAWAFWVMKDYGDTNSWTKLFFIYSFPGLDKVLGVYKNRPSFVCET